MDKIIAACGNDCSKCPRYVKPPYEKTEEQLLDTAKLWMKIGYRDHVVSTDEISCTGCKPENWCRYRIVKCCEGRGITNCAHCPDYPCENILECFTVTESFEPMCRKACTDEEFEQLQKAFFEKEKNLMSAKAVKAGKILETNSLYLREMGMDDYDALFSVLADTDSMRHYPYTFDEQRVRDWIGRNMRRYREDGFGLWAVCLKDTGEMIGDCGLTLQNIDGSLLPEIGYHIRRDCQRKGYAAEAARAVRDWAFQNTEYPALYSYCKYTNTASIRTAEAIGMRFDREYPDPDNVITHVSVIYRCEE